MKSDKKEVSVAEATREILDRRPFLKELMEMDAVNYRGLARNFREEIEEKTGRSEVNLDSIVVAIRRYEEDMLLTDGLTERIQRVLQNSELFMIGDIVYYTLPREEKYHELAMAVYDKIERKSGERAYILQSDAEIGLIIGKSNADLVEEKVDESEFKNVERELAMVVMESPEEILEADGILSYLTEKIIMNGIGLVDMVATYTETVFLVRDEDAPELYSVLRGLVNSHSTEAGSGLHQ